MNQDFTKLFDPASMQQNMQQAMQQWQKMMTVSPMMGGQNSSLDTMKQVSTL